MTPGRPILDYVLAQDAIVWTAQGEIVDRSEELLGRSDVPIVLLRRQLDEQIKLVEEGKTPMNWFAQSPDVIHGAAPNKPNLDMLLAGQLPQALSQGLRSRRRRPLRARDRPGERPAPPDRRSRDRCARQGQSRPRRRRGYVTGSETSTAWSRPSSRPGNMSSMRARRSQTNLLRPS